jgi:hypothetical protein
VRFLNGKWTVLAVLLTGLVGCGGDDPFDGPPPPGAGEVALTEKSDKVVHPERENPAWNDLCQFFLGKVELCADIGTTDVEPGTGFVRTFGLDIRDPFEPQLVKFVNRMDLVESEEASEEESEAMTIVNKPQPTAKDARQSFPAADYQVRMIMWGGSVNKALVEDPDGSHYVITKDEPLGNNNGRIANITEWTVEVVEDNLPDKIVLSMEPRLLGPRTGKVVGSTLGTMH